METISYEKNPEKEKLEQWAKWERDEFPDAKPEVLQFIIDFTCSYARTGAAAEIIRSTFRAGYCWHFAHMLKTTFQRGDVCWTAPFGHFVWMDDNGIPYDIEGVHTGECDYYIPESYLGDHVHDFMHIPEDQTAPATKDQVIGIIRDYEDRNDLPHKAIDVTSLRCAKPLTGPEAEEYIFETSTKARIVACDISEAVRIFEAAYPDTYAKDVTEITSRDVKMVKTKSKTTGETIWFRPGCPYGNASCKDDPMRKIAEDSRCQNDLSGKPQETCPVAKWCDGMPNKFL